jgi:hypothetical protein
MTAHHIFPFGIVALQLNKGDFDQLRDSEAAISCSSHPALLLQPHQNHAKKNDGSGANVKFEFLAIEQAAPKTLFSRRERDLSQFGWGWKERRMYFKVDIAPGSETQSSTHAALGCSYFILRTPFALPHWPTVVLRTTLLWMRSTTLNRPMRSGLGASETKTQSNCLVYMSPLCAKM